MHFSRLSAVALVSLVSAAPLEKREIGYGNRADYAAAWNAQATASTYAPAPGQGQYGYPTPGVPAPAPVPSYGAAPPSYSAPSGGYNPAPPAGTPAAGGSSGSGAVTFPLLNGFPNIDNPSAALSAINQQAHGTLPNGPPPASVQPDDVTSFRLIAFNEIFETFYFTELVQNITNNVPGYEFQDQGLKKQVLDALTAIVAQEELHTLNANGLLKKLNAGPIQPCQYKAPVSDFKSAITLAMTFTDVVLGTLQDVATKLGLNGDGNAIRGVVSVVGQEGEQVGYFRSLLGKIPSELPFLSQSSREFAFSALNQNFVVPGTCPNINTIGLPVFGALNVLTPNIAAQDSNIQFSFAPSNGVNSADGLSLVYINQQNKPIVQAITGAQNQGGQITFSAPFPYTANVMNGLTIAAVTRGAGPFTNVDDVAKAALYGPGLIEIN